MGAIRDSVKVVITRETAAVAQQGFGIPLFLAVHNQPEVTYKVSSPQAASSKFGANSPIVDAVNAFYAQGAGPDSIVIGKVANTATGAASQTTTVTVTGTIFTVGSSATVQIGTLAKKYVFGVAESVTSIAAALSALINNDTSLNTKVLATPTAGVIAITCKPGTVSFSCIASAINLLTGDATCGVTTPYALAVGQNNIITIGTPDADEVFNLVINSQIISYTALSTDTATTIAQSLMQKIVNTSALIGQIVAIYDNATPTIIYLMANGTQVAYSLKTYATLHGAVVVGDITEGAMAGLTYDLVASLDAALASDPSWYGVTCQHLGYTAEQVSNSEIIAGHLAGWSTTTPKLFGTVTDEAATKDTAWSSGTLSDLGNYLRSKGYDRTYWFWSYHPETYIECGIMGLQFTKTPGSSTWKFKQLTGPIPDTLTDNDRANLNHHEDGTGKNGNYFETIAGLNVVSSEATVAIGEYIDIMYGIDYLTARISEAVFQYLVSQEKVPFTNAGINAVASKVRGVLEANPDLIDPTTIIMNIPDVTQISAADKAARYLNKIAFSAIFTGAIQSVLIEGKLSV